MKKTFISVICLISLLLIGTMAYAEKTELYALDGRTMMVDENQISVYTADGMGWFLEKPVTMYSADGRTIVVPANQVEAHEAVGWFVTKDDISTDAPSTEPEKSDSEQKPVAEEAMIKYKNGIIIKVPQDQVATYKTLGWEKIELQFDKNGKVKMYNSKGESRSVSMEDVEVFLESGWLFATSEKEPDEVIPSEDEVTVTMYHYNGTTKQVAQSEIEAYKKKSWGLTFDEAVYAFKIFGDEENKGAVELLENKRYELAYLNIEDALSKIEAGNSEYVNMLYTFRSEIVNSWYAAAKSPLGFINYWFDNRDGKRVAIFEYRNIGNKRITYLAINFDICNSNGEVIETNSGSYFVNNLQVVPCDKTRVGWIIKSGDAATSVKNVKVKEVRFADGTVWKAEE